MSNLATVLKKINEGIDKEAENFVYFEEQTGVIKKITNSEDTDAEYKMVKVPHSQVRDILIGKFKYKDFLVSYDVNKKNFTLKKAKQIKLTEDMKDEFFSVVSDVYLIDDDDEITLEEVYKDLTVYMYNKNFSYSKGNFVWYDNSVYKLKKNISIGTSLKNTNSELYIENVKITDIKINNDLTLKENETTFEDIYDGIRVDVWYDRLEHLAGQHVWYDNAVYRMTEYQAKNTKFNKENAELILKSVKLYSDENSTLEFNKNIKSGDKILNNRQMQLVKIKSTNTVNFSSNNNIIFYISESTVIFYKDEKTYFYTDQVLKETQQLKGIVNKSSLRRGDILLLGNNLFSVKKIKSQTSKPKNVLNIIRDCKNNCWVFNFDNDIPLLNALSNIEFFEKNLYFSITEIDNPNILYRFIKIKLSELLKEKKLEIPFKYSWEFTEEEVSIYTNKHFDNYSYGIIKCSKENLEQ